MRPIFTTILGLVAISLVLPFHAGEADAQELTIAKKAKQKDVEIHIVGDGSVHVRHVVQSDSVPRQVGLVDGERSNMQVSGEEDEVTYARAGGDSIVLFPSDSDVVIEYDLVGGPILVGGVWTWDFLYLETTKFFFPDSIEMIFVNGNPVMLDGKAVNCHGCQMILEFLEDGGVQVETAAWEEYEFAVQVISPAEPITSFDFSQPSKSIRFDVARGDVPTTVILPLELLWEPYEVYMDDQRIQDHSISNGTHVWLSIRPESAGTVTIIGTTVVPEFSLFLPLVVGIALVAALQLGGRHALIPH